MNTSLKSALALLALLVISTKTGLGQEPVPDLDPLSPLPALEPPRLFEPTKEANARSSADRRSALFMVGVPDVGFATAFVIDREQRLLVTNAHVADQYFSHGRLYAILNGTTSIYKVQRVWYHPGVKRHIGGFRFQAAKSTDPRDGGVDVNSPDIAILQLSSEGNALPAEVPIAPMESLADLFAAQVSMIGFPGHSNAWPEIGVAPHATYETGVINRTTDYIGEQPFGIDKQQVVQHNLRSSPGGSGAPIFNAEGHVVAVHSSYRLTADNPLFFAIRADAIWEALKYYQLLPAKTDLIDSRTLALERFEGIDPSLEMFRFATAKFDEASDLTESGSFSQASQRAKAILEKYPNNPLGLFASAMVYMESSNRLRGQIATEKLYQQYELALKYIREFQQRMPGELAGDVTEMRILSNMTIVNYSRGKVAEAKQFGHKLLPYLSETLAVPELSDTDTVRMLHARARIREIVGDIAGGSADLDEAVRLFPNHPLAYYYRASWNQRVLKRADLAQLDRKQMDALAAKNQVG